MSETREKHWGLLKVLVVVVVVFVCALMVQSRSVNVYPVVHSDGRDAAWVTKGGEVWYVKVLEMKPQAFFNAAHKVKFYDNLQSITAAMMKAEVERELKARLEAEVEESDTE